MFRSPLTFLSQRLRENKINPGMIGDTFGIALLHLRNPELLSTWRHKCLSPGRCSLSRIMPPSPASIEDFESCMASFPIINTVSRNLLIRGRKQLIKPLHSFSSRNPSPVSSRVVSEESFRGSHLRSGFRNIVPSCLRKTNYQI